jgi:SAM-dependent methyltransferase
MPATYTHGHHETVLRSHRARTVENSAAYLLPYLREDQSLLDVGCGPGTITCDFAQRVATVTAHELTSDALDLARNEAAARGVTNVAFVASDVDPLALPDDTFDVVHAHQVLQHVADPVAALREMRRVCKPGGVVAARDGDYAGFTWYPQLPELEEWRALYSRAARANGGEPDAGRRLLSWAQAAGFTDVTVSASTWCYATPETRAFWGDGWADRMTQSQIAQQCVRDGLATADDLARIADGWRRWAAADDGWIAVLHGEIICRA